MGGSIRVAVVDDHPLFREGVACVLQAADGIELVADGAGLDALARIARDTAPDIILTDLELSPARMDAIGGIVQAHPGTKIVMLTASESEWHVSTLMKSGVVGYVLKGVTGAELVRTVREIHQGARYVDPTLAAMILARQVSAPTPAPAGLQELTSREGQIVGQVAKGLTNKEVARALTISEKTVKHYMTSIMQKLQVRNRTELVLIASTNLDSDGRPALRNSA